MAAAEEYSQKLDLSDELKRQVKNETSFKKILTLLNDSSPPLDSGRFAARLRTQCHGSKYPGNFQESQSLFQMRPNRICADILRQL